MSSYLWLNRPWTLLLLDLLIVLCMSRHLVCSHTNVEANGGDSHNFYTLFLSEKYLSSSVSHHIIDKFPLKITNESMFPLCVSITTKENDFLSALWIKPQSSVHLAAFVLKRVVLFCNRDWVLWASARREWRSAAMDTQVDAREVRQPEPGWAPSRWVTHRQTHGVQHASHSGNKELVAFGDFDFFLTKQSNQEFALLQLILDVLLLIKTM